jgi:hypothetical protein
MVDGAARSNYWKRPVLESVIPVVEGSRHVATSRDAIQAVAGWMAYETFIFPSGSLIAIDEGHTYVVEDLDTFALRRFGTDIEGKADHGT